MKKKINRITGKIALTLIIAGLAVALLLPRLSARSSASAQTASRPSDAPSLQGEDAIRSLKEQGLYDSLREAVAATRYDLRWESAPARWALPPAYHAPNPAQQYDAYFTPKGLSLAPHTAAPNAAESANAANETTQAGKAPEWLATMRLAGYGYGDGLSTVEAATLEARGNRIEYRRAWPPITEWYVNKSAGLEQGFTIEAPPGAKSEGEQLRLVLELTGDLSAELIEEGQAIALKQADGELALSYTGLYAYDAQGRELPSRMRVSKGHVILEVDDEQAAYPVTIDPTFSQQAQLTSACSGEAGDLFGYSVAFYWDTAVVGAPYDDVTISGVTRVDQGSAYVFFRSGLTWSRQAQLTAHPNLATADDRFGHSVAIHLDTIVVGAPEPNAGSGSAYVFVRSGSGSGATWSQRFELPASHRATGDRFGHSVAINSDLTIVVGAPNQNVSFNDQGAAFVFVRNGAGWIEQRRLVAGNQQAGALFGTSVAINENSGFGSRIVVGAPNEGIVANNVTTTSQGSAYVFVRNNNGIWNQEAKLTASDGAAYDEFGFSVGITGTASRIVVGARFDDVVVNGVTRNDQGSAYVFVRSNTFWSQEAQLTASGGGNNDNGAANDNFGHSVAISGYDVVVGAPYDDVVALSIIGPVTKPNQGSAYPFVYSNGAWSQQPRLAASDGATNDNFGFSVAINSSGATSTVVVGAHYDDVTTFCNNNPVTKADQGSAYVFVR
jgi:hypothetical protein